MSVTRADLCPVVRFDAGFEVDAGKLERMQVRAHRYCFIANALADSGEVNIAAASARVDIRLWALPFPAAGLI